MKNRLNLFNDYFFLSNSLNLNQYLYKTVFKNQQNLQNFLDHYNENKN